MTAPAKPDALSVTAGRTLAEIKLPCGCVPCDRHLDALVTARDIEQYREQRDEEEQAEVFDAGGKS